MENSSNSKEKPDKDSSESLTLSLTPPLSATAKNDDSSISEHLSSIENDRSMQELELSATLPRDDFKSGDALKTLETSLNSVSLNGLELFISSNLEGRNNATSILEEILNNERFKSDTESAEASLDIFANVDLDDKLMNSYNKNKPDFNLTSLKSDSFENYGDICKKVKEFEEIIAIKDNTIAALTSELDSFREIISNTSSNSTEYKQYQDECHSKLVEYHDAITHKDEQIEKLSISLQQSILQREELRQQFKNEIAQLQEELSQTSKLLRDHKCCNDESNQGKQYENEINNLKIKLENDRARYEAELQKLKSENDVILAQKNELEAQHSKEMEELRTYFEKKCSDLEKNYSEEVFSQQSRKVSLSTSGSDTEISSDFIFNQPGATGDVEYTKKDALKLKESLAQILQNLSQFNIKELTDEEFDKVKSEIAKFDLKNLLKYDLSLIKNELQNKYHAELEILREDFDNRVDVLRVEHENKLKSVESKYKEEIEDLNNQLRGRISVVTQQEVALSGDFEIDEVIQSYERRLQEQVTMAKIDIINALENQIQRLVSSDSLDEEWPEELLQLKNRFSEKYQREISALNEAHREEISRLKEEHVKNLNGALERARRRSLRDADSLSKGELELLRERDALKKQTLSLRNLLGELLKYFTQCEDELNNTLVEELISKNQVNFDESQGDVKRVHLTPNFSDLINLIDSSRDDDLDSLDLKSELGLCLEKLKSDANAILTLTNNMRDDSKRSSTSDNELTSLTRKLISETQLRNELAEQLNEAKSIIQSLESDRVTLEKQLEELLERQKIVECDLQKAREKISELIENGHREIISEGYGEDGRDKTNMVDVIASLRDLQEKSRQYLENPNNLDQNLLRMIDDLGRIGEKIIEEAQKDRDDLKLQIEAADKKYRITCQFLEDQANEREQERDEAQREIDRLIQLLKDRDKDRASCEQIMNEVDNLEQQVRELTRSIEISEERCKEAESERREAIEKIYELREIIKDLEEQLRVKTQTETQLRDIIEELESFVKNHTRSDDESNQDLLSEESRNRKRVVNQELKSYIESLEDELQKLRLSSELAGNEGALQQIKNHLCDFELTLDKRTRDLETIPSAISTTCSSPSEDMSIRDVINTNNKIHDECEVPLQQLSRLKEKLLRHSRAEDAALKRIRDLEMQINTLKTDLDENLSEKEMLKRQISDHLVMISNLQIRLDEQRIRAEHIEKQTNTSLEVQNYDLRNTIVSLEEKLAAKDKVIAQLQVSIEETKRRLLDRENDLIQNSSKEAEIVAQMQMELESLRSENLKLKKLDKSSEIENKSLREKLSDSERKLEIFLSWNLRQKEIDRVNDLIKTGVSFEELLDVEEERVRRVNANEDSLVNSQEVPYKRNINETVFLGGEPEISSIEKTGSPKMFHSLQTPISKPNSTEKHVRFEGDLEKDAIIADLQAKLKTLTDLENKVKLLQDSLDETEEILKNTKQTFEEEINKNNTNIQKLNTEIDSYKTTLNAKNKQIDSLTSNLASIEKQLNSKQAEIDELTNQNQHLNNILRQKDDEINSKQEKLDALTNQSSETQQQLHHLHSLLCEKDKIISQMSEDSKSLHANLETIQAKLTETGNVVDLSRRLREEQKRSADMLQELHSVKAQLLAFDKKSLDDVTEQVQRELDYSAYLDQTLISAVEDNASLEDAEGLKIIVRKQKSINKQLMKAKQALEKRFDDLERQFDGLKQVLEQTKQLLQAERTQSQSVQIEDAKIIEQLRLKLDSALDSQSDLEKNLSEERRRRHECENQIKDLKHTVEILKLNASDVTDASLENREKLLADKRALEKKLDLIEETNENLNDELTKLRKLRRKNDDELKIKDDAIKTLENRIETLKAQENKITQLSEDLKIELLEKTKEVEKYKHLTNEIESDRKTMKRQMDLLNQRLKSRDLNLPIPEELLEKIKELKTVAQNNMQMVDLVTRLTNEKSALEERIIVLEAQNLRNLPFDDPVSRANYLFAKYLRAESYRKALSWQKRYLISLLETYQSYQNKNLQISMTATVSESKRSSGKKRFKCVALMLVSMARMKYLVRRWHSGQRLIKERHKNVEFQVGKPVSSQNFTSTNHSALSSRNQVDVWSGNSPPSKDASARIKSRVSEETLTSPGLLSKYMERFTQIQERLGLEGGQ